MRSPFETAKQRLAGRAWGIWTVVFRLAAQTLQFGGATDRFQSIQNSIFQFVFSFQRLAFRCFPLNLDQMKADCPLNLANMRPPTVCPVLTPSSATYSR